MASTSHAVFPPPDPLLLPHPTAIIDDNNVAPITAAARPDLKRAVLATLCMVPPEMDLRRDLVAGASEKSGGTAAKRLRQTCRRSSPTDGRRRPGSRCRCDPPGRPTPA